MSKKLEKIQTVTPLVEIEGLTVRFPVGRKLSAVLDRSTYLTAVNDISFTIGYGEVLALVGESGSGKTTLGKTILRLNDATSGTIRYKGQEITQLSEVKLRPIIGQMQMIFQDPATSLNPRQTIAQSLATPMRVNKAHPKKEIPAQVDRLLDTVGLSQSVKWRFPHELSGGQLQRVSIGRCLALNPSLIVADEAVSKLDVSVRAQILNLLKDVQKEYGVSILFITHDLHVARYISDRIAVMYFGRLLEIGPTDVIYDTPVHPYTKALLGTIRLNHNEETIATEITSPTNDSSGCRYYERCAVRIAKCLTSHPPLTVAGDVDHLVGCYRERTPEQNLTAENS